MAYRGAMAAPDEPLHDARRRKLAAFCRLLCRYRELDFASQEGIARMAVVIRDSGLTRADRDSTLREIDGWLHEHDDGMPVGDVAPGV